MNSINTNITEIQEDPQLAKKTNAYQIKES